MMVSKLVLQTCLHLTVFSVIHFRNNIGLGLVISSQLKAWVLRTKQSLLIFSDNGTSWLEDTSKTPILQKTFLVSEMKQLIPIMNSIWGKITTAYELAVTAVLSGLKKTRHTEAFLSLKSSLKALK